MKNKLLLFLSILFISININAQSEITGFWGINLDDKPYVAIDKLKKRFTNTKWEYPHIKIEDVSFLGQKFDSLVMTYRNEKLTEAVFTLSKSGIAVLRHHQDINLFLTEGQAAQNRIANLLTQLYNDFATILYSKYGESIISSQKSLVWKDTNSNSITLNVTYNTLHDEYIMGARGNITITYRPYSTISDNEF